MLRENNHSRRAIEARNAKVFLSVLLEDHLLNLILANGHCDWTVLEFVEPVLTEFQFVAELNIDSGHSGKLLGFGGYQGKWAF